MRKKYAQLATSGNPFATPTNLHLAPVSSILTRCCNPAGNFVQSHTPHKDSVLTVGLGEVPSVDWLKKTAAKVCVDRLDPGPLACSCMEQCTMMGNGLPKAVLCP